MISRIPVIYKSKPLMPTRLSKANRLVLEGKAKWYHSKNFRLNYLKLLVPPSGYEFQDIHLGFDPGSHFDGLSISSKRYNHTNLELIHNKGIKDRMNSRRGNRRIRRSQLRRRPARFESRNKSKITPTIRSMLEFRKFIVSNLIKLFPLNKVIFERVAYRGSNQFSFTQVHQGQLAFINFLKTIISRVSIVKGYHTKNKRKQSQLSTVSGCHRRPGRCGGRGSRLQA
jgi:hypothetical protein